MGSIRKEKDGEFDFDKLPEGKDIPYGRFNKPRPDVTLDKGN